jgi:pyruvate,water dikinase
VEWVIDKEHLWILQARPVTAVQATADPTNADSEWSRANFKETMPELPSPMGLSFLERFMDEYILSHYRRLGCRIPHGLSSVLTYSGRPYLNVTLFHMLVTQLGGDPLLNAEQLGGDPVQSIPDVQPLPWPRLVRAAWLMWREMRRAFRCSADAFADMKALASRYSADRVAQWSLMDVSTTLDELGRWLESREMTFAIAAGAGQCLQVFSRLLPRWLGPDWRRLLNGSLQGQGTVISAAQILRIADLTRLAREDARVSHALGDGWEPTDYRRSFEGSRFLSAFDSYLSDYGHRAVGESDVMSPRLADQPETLLHVIKTQLSAAPITSEELIGRQREARDQALATIRARLGWRLDRWCLFRWWYQRLCGLLALREANRHHLMWYSLAGRNLLLRLGELLVDRGMFSRKEDIFFLTLREREVLDKAPADTWSTLIKARRAERERWKTVDVPDSIRGSQDAQPESQRPLANGDPLLRGIPVSAGIVSGPVRFVRATSDWCRVKSGDIIVAPVIDPGMAPLFGIAAGLIVEMGGSLSHGAIIAREYGLPAIANVSRVMSRLSEDEYVTVDAGEGIVQRHIAASGP